MRNVLGKIPVLKSILVLIVFFILSCSNENTYKVKTINGVKTFLNRNTPQDSTFQINLDSLPGYKHNEMRHIADVVMDQEKNVYALEWKNSNVFKFDSLGRFNFVLGRKGSGPGEIQFASKIFLLSDTLFIVDSYAKKFIKFNKNNGQFLEDIHNSDFSFSEDFKKLSDHKIIKKRNEVNDNQGKLTSTNSLEILNNDFSISKIILKEQIQELEKGEVFANNIICGFNSWQKNKELYLYNKSYDNYEIDVFDLNGKLKHRIRKYHKKIPFSLYKKEFSKSFGSAFKFSVLDLMLDKDGYLWSVNNLPDKKDDFNQDLVVDIFKDGVYLNNIKLPLKNATDFINVYHQSYLYGDRLINRSIEHGLRVYKYSYVSKRK